MMRVGTSGWSYAEEAVGNVTARMAPLKSFLGVWLWQLPPNLKKDVERLDSFLALLPGGARHAVEFRERSWWDDDVLAVLANHGVVLTDMLNA